MNKSNFARFIKDVKTVVSVHSPEILMGIGIAGMVTTTVLAVRATPKALKLIEQKKEEDSVDKLTPVETVKATWKCYVPAAVMGASSIACLIGSSRVSAKRNAALATAYKLSETALSEYKEKVIETIGEKKEQAIRDKIDQDHVERDPVSQHEVIVTGKGTTLCYDYQSGRYFDSDIESIRKAVNTINRRMLIQDYVSLNEFYDELGLKHTKIGDDLGWRIDRGYIEERFSSHIADDGRPCLVLNYSVAPQHDYYSCL